MQNDDNKKMSIHTGMFWEARCRALVPAAGGPRATGLQSPFPGRQSSGVTWSHQVCEGPALADPLAAAQSGHTPGRGSCQTWLLRSKMSDLCPWHVPLSCPCISFGENYEKQLGAQKSQCSVGTQRLLHGDHASAVGGHVRLTRHTCVSHAGAPGAACAVLFSVRVMKGPGWPTTPPRTFRSLVLRRHCF